ncbi:MAG: flagellar hook-basal body protein [Lachnospiraceae bacterium]|nr:flagellar hook-basal body protein [Candidatus Colinaster scatohippi]
MVRSLWSAASGMIAQQTNLDVIANNLANVNSTGYKAETAEFKSLLYQRMQTETTTANGEHKPISAQVGLGVRNSSVTSNFKQGALLASESDTAFAIEGKGFFAVRDIDGSTKYTRNGNFLFNTNGRNSLMLSTSDGLPVLDTNGRPIAINTNTYSASKISVDAEGRLCYPDANNNAQPIGIQIGLYQFNNPSGLEKVNDTMYGATEASGQAMNESRNANLDRSRVLQGYLEGSSVQVVDEMVNMIVAQRAYEMNSRAITTTDSMMETANNLRR